MTRAREWINSLAGALIIAVFDVIAWALNHTPKEPW